MLNNLGGYPQATARHLYNTAIIIPILPMMIFLNEWMNEHNIIYDHDNGKNIY